MRKREKEQLLTILSEEKTVFTEMEGASSAVSRETCLQRIADCQETLIEIGNFIEEREGVGTSVVPLIEQACEVLFTTYGQWQQEDWQDDSSIAACREHLEEIEDSIRDSIRSKEEVIFLPYKAAMWDSLETVYQKEAEREDCDAYVIPIPYFDKKSDGTLGEMHYEGDLYPKDIPITHYEQYDIENRHPDRIYILNPYDNCNTVTSVHPFFYAKHLAKLTEELVYIPYFILADPNPNNQAELDGIQNFVTQPGVFWSHRVIVQSEAMRQAYINILVKIFGEQTRERWEKKIEGTGSPKLEKLLQTTREDQQIPESWQDKMIRPDGTRKKVILYNTGLAAFLETPERMLHKIQDVLTFFRREQEQVTLLWRPHPLLRTTIGNQDPRMQASYDQMVETYLREDWGIYDDTPDLHRAIAISDAYYGDPSSVVQLYKATGKPIMIQNVYVLMEE